MINPLYFSQLKSLKKAFNTDQQFPHLTLYEFLDQEYYQRLKDRISQLTFKLEQNHLSHSLSLSEIPVLFKQYLNSREFQKFISDIIGQKIKILSAKIYQLNRGNYLIRSDLISKDYSAEIILDLTSAWNKQWGGYISYANETGDVLTLPIKENICTIIERKHAINSFIKYVNHHAGSKKRIFCIIRVKFF